MKIIAALSVFLLAGCGLASRPIPEADIAAARAQAAQRASITCTNYGFRENTTPPISSCVESATLAAIEGRYGWERMRASGLYYMGTEEMAGIARCISNGVTPSDARMPGCIQANAAMVLREDNMHRAEMRSRVPQPVFIPQPIYTPPPRLQTTCQRIGNMTYCN
jgi:hypothetical protein